MNHDVVITLLGEYKICLSGISEEKAKELIYWFDNVDDKKSFKIDIVSENKTKAFRRELILDIDVI